MPVDRFAYRQTYIKLIAYAVENERPRLTSRQRWKRAELLSAPQLDMIRPLNANNVLCVFHCLAEQSRTTGVLLSSECGTTGHDGNAQHPTESRRSEDVMHDQAIHRAPAKLQVLFYNINKDGIDSVVVAVVSPVESGSIRAGSPAACLLPRRPSNLKAQVFPYYPRQITHTPESCGGEYSGFCSLFR